MARPSVSIAKVPEPPYPINAESEVISGFGRGSSELGIPTANINIVGTELTKLETGVYFGWCKVTKLPKKSEIKKRVDGTDIEFLYGDGLSSKDFDILPMVMSIGWNPFYKNKDKTAEIHVMHSFSKSFYGANISFNVLGYIRPELNYTTKEALIEDINKDIEIASEVLSTQEYQSYKSLL